MKYMIINKKANLLFFSLLLCGGLLKAQDINYADVQSMGIWYNQSLKMDRQREVKFDLRKVNYANLMAYSSGGILINIPLLDKYQKMEDEGGSYLSMTAGAAYDKSNAGIYQQSIGLLGLSYAKKLSADNLHVSAGFQGTFSRNSYNLSGAGFPDQFDEFGPIPNRVSDDPIQSARSFQYLSVNSGVSVFKKTAKQEWYVGTSVRHINRPFSEETKNVNYRLAPTGGMQGGMKWILEQRMIDLYGVTNWKAGASEYLGGIRYSVLLGDSKIREQSTVVGVGCAVRFQDAIIPNLSLKFQQTQVALHYDIHVAGNNSSSFSRTGFELMISKQF